MPFTIQTRYGAMEQYTDDAKIPEAVAFLIEELETEQFDEPDDEHYQVAVCHGDWAVTATVYGLMILSDLDSGQELFKRAADRDEAIELLTLLARGEVDAVRASGWTPRDQVPPWERDLFRKPREQAGEPDTAPDPANPGLWRAQ
jgi:hypothetical protein